MPQVFETADLEEIDDLFRQQYASTRLRLTGDRHRLRISQEDLGRVRLEHLYMPMELDTRSEPLGALAVGRVLHGQLHYQFRRAEQHLVGGDVFLAVPPHLGFRATHRDVDVEYGLLDPGLLGEVAQNAPGVSGPVRLLALRPLNPLAASQWAHTFGWSGSWLPAPWR
ncbi:hypothetical protein ABZ930_07360 [Streptomyces sp. NPDC046716]|uniref:hypothetical protein n=1 Tax=Streptomyces sp. NPDC046716 TaxID=3157093 RepID=UPI0033F18741